MLEDAIKEALEVIELIKSILGDKSPLRPVRHLYN